MTSPLRRLHLQLAEPRPTLGEGLDLDGFSVEYTDDGAHMDFRLQLGQDLDILWALAYADGDRLRLIHVDSAVYHVDEPTVRADPFTCDVALRWDGELANGSTIVAVAFTATTAPPAYRCAIDVRDAAGITSTRVFAWGA